MPKSILRFFALSIVCAAGAFGQGTFGQIAFGGGWQTTFTLLNLDPLNVASVTLSFYSDAGSPLSAPVQGVGTLSTYTFTIPARGAQSVVLSGSESVTSQGWANMTTAGGVVVRGQGSFRLHVLGRQDSEAVVPLSTSGSTQCIIPFPTAPVLVIPFDNTSGQYITSMAVANTTNTAQTASIEFDDQFNTPLVTDTLNLGALQHMAFSTIDKYPALAGKKGILRISQATNPALPNTTNLTVLGLLFNFTGPFTTILPVAQ
ncbi:MAG: hypothetical protein LAO55_12585 [Acidobacteriia bacterium]|nr:hypothetical protein [Terriglobia bacterium]